MNTMNTLITLNILSDILDLVSTAHNVPAASQDLKCIKLRENLKFHWKRLELGLGLSHCAP